MDLTVTIKDLKGLPMGSTEVILTETITRKVIKSKTNAQGVAVFSVREGKVWQMDVLQIKSYYQWQFIVPDIGISTQSYTFAYDLKGYQRKMRPPVDRSKLDLKVVKQSVKATDKPGAGECLIKIKLYRKDKKPLMEFPVQLTCYKQLTSYQTKTNYLGECIFKVPDNSDYEIDLEGIETYSYIDVGKGQLVHGLNFMFEPMNFKETIVNDTITQQLSTNHQEISARFLLKLECLYQDGEFCPNKVIYLKEKQGKKVYKASSNSEGLAWFMLPKGKSYESTLSNEGILSQTIDVIDLTRAFGMGGGSKSAKVCMKVEKKREMPKNLTLIDINDLEKYRSLFSRHGIDLVNFSNNSVPHWAKNILVYEDSDSSLGIKTGFLLCNGTVLNAIGPNDVTYASAGHSPYIVSDLPAELKGTEGVNYDACMLSIEFIPQKENLTLSYLFGSEEYPEFINYDDIAGIYIEGDGLNKAENLALLPDGKTQVCIKNVNPAMNKQYYIANDKPNSSRLNTWQYDGFTKRFAVTKKVVPGKTYKLTLIITDRRDNIYDSGLFVGIETK